MTPDTAITWLIEVDELLGAGFHCYNSAEEYGCQLPDDFEAKRQKYLEFAERFGIDPYAFAMETMPSFKDLTAQFAQGAIQ